MRSQDTGGFHSGVAFVCLAGAVGILAYVAYMGHIRLDASFRFLEAFLRQTEWTWAAGGFALAIIGCVAGEKARNRGAGLLAGLFVAGCLILALGYGMILLYSVGGLVEILNFLR
jgi:hypothetical protein